MDARDLGPLPAVHPRHEAVERARRELLGFRLEWRERHGLTLAEELASLSAEMTSILWLAVRSERRQAEEQARDRAPADEKKAIEAERERIIALAERLEATYEESRPNTTEPPFFGRVVEVKAFADAIRSETS